MKIYANTVFTGRIVLTNQAIDIADGKINKIVPGCISPGTINVDCIAPGFIDAQINGGSNLHFTKRPDTKTLSDIALSCSAEGTAYTLPSLITSPTENILSGVNSIIKFRDLNPNAGIIGMHLEGTFINPVKRGAHLSAYIRRATLEDIQTIINCKQAITLLTIAPEMLNKQSIQDLVDSGIVVAVGHSNATYKQAMVAFEQGVRLVTHLYNAMSSFNHRDPGIVGAVFDSPQVYAPIILDGLHCDFSAARIAWKVKREKLFLVSDALFIGRKLKSFQWGNFNSILSGNAYYNSEGNLSGSAISLAEAVYNAVNYVGIPLQEAVEMASIRPAIALGIDNKIGRIEIGYPARFTTFEASLKNFKTLDFI